jgi:hypothetical protein
MKDWKKLNKFLKICLDIAEWYDNRGEEDRNWFGGEMTEGIGLGYKSMTGYLRTGVAEVIKLQGELHSAKERRWYAESSERNMRDYLTEIFGDEEPETLSNEITAKIKNAVHEILESEGE